MPRQILKRWVSGRRNSGKVLMNASTPHNSDELPPSKKRPRSQSNDHDPSDLTTSPLSITLTQAERSSKETDTVAPLKSPGASTEGKSIPSPSSSPAMPATPCQSLEQKDPAIPILLSRLLQWQGEIQRQQSLLEQFRQQNQSMLDLIQQQILARDSQSLEKPKSSSLETTQYVSHQNSDKEDVIAVYKSESFSSTRPPWNGNTKGIRDGMNEGNNRLEPQELVSTFDANPSNRVSLERPPSQMTPRSTMKYDTIKPSTTTDKTSAFVRTSMLPFSHDVARSDNVVNIERDDDTVHSTQTIDPSKLGFSLKTDIQKQAVPFTVPNGIENDKPLNASPPLSPRNDLFVPNINSSFGDPTKKKKKPLQITSANNDNLKTKSVGATDSTTATAKRRSHVGWVSNRPARVFLRQMDEQPISRTTTGESMPPKSEDDPAKLVSSKKPIPGDLLEEESPIGSKYAYKEVVRKQRERQTLNCYDCPNCQKFYAALRKAGHEADISIENREAVCPMTADCQNPTIPKRDVSFGRHRARFAPSETPVDFWELDFIDERDATTSTSKTMESRRLKGPNMSI